MNPLVFQFCPRVDSKLSGCDGPCRSVAVRSYPSSKVRGSYLESQAATPQERWLGGTSPRPKSGAAAERSFPTSEVRGSGREELSHVWGQGHWLRGATLHQRSGMAAEKTYHMPSSGAAAKRSNPTSKEQLLWGAGGLKGATPHSRCQGQEGRQWEDTPRPR